MTSHILQVAITTLYSTIVGYKDDTFPFQHVGANNSITGINIIHN